MAEATAFGRAFDQSGNVRHHELRCVARTSAAFADAHHAKIRHECREGIVRDLGSGRRNARDQRGLPDVGKTDQGDVGLQLQFEVEPVLLAVLTLFGEGRRASVVGEKPIIALTTESALGGEPTVPWSVQVNEELALAAVDHCPDRHDDHLILAP